MAKVVQKKTMDDVYDEGETVWVTVNARDFESSQKLSDALETELNEQIVDLDYVYAERRGEVSIRGGEVALVMTSGGDDGFKEWVEGRGFGEARTVHVAFDFGLEEVRVLVD